MNSRARGVALAVGLLIASAPSMAATDAPFLWRVQGARAVHYLMGSVHLLPDTVYPLPAALDQAYAQTQGLVLETDPAALAAPDTQRRMFSEGTAADGLQTQVSPALYAQVQRYAESQQVPVNVCDRFNAWFCGLTLGLIEFQRAGLDPAQGLDQHFYQRALAQGRSIAWLESPEAQIQVFAGMDATMSAQFLASALEDLRRPETRPDALVRLWRENRVADMAQLAAQMRRDYPDIDARLLAARNQAWIAPLRARLDDAVPQLVIVGAAHLVGPGGLVARLRQQGYAVSAVADDDAVP